MNAQKKVPVRLWIILTVKTPWGPISVYAERDTKPFMIPTSGWRNAKVTENSWRDQMHFEQMCFLTTAGKVYF